MLWNIQLYISEEENHCQIKSESNLGTYPKFFPVIGLFCGSWFVKGRLVEVMTEVIAPVTHYPTINKLVKSVTPSIQSAHSYS